MERQMVTKVSNPASCWLSKSEIYSEFKFSGYIKILSLFLGNSFLKTQKMFEIFQRKFRNVNDSSMSLI